MKHYETEVTQSRSRLSFSTRNGDQRPWWRYLDFDHQPLYLIGNICDTCPAIFGLAGVAELPLAPSEVSEKLRAGLDRVPPSVVDTIAQLLPKGKYIVGLIPVEPGLIEMRHPQEAPDPAAGDPIQAHVHDPAFQHQNRPDYYWEHKPPKNRYFHEVFLPVVARASLSEERIRYYQQQLQAGVIPTALALTVVDVRTPGGRYMESYLAHFLLDGHHKMMAASRLGKTIYLLSFLAVNDSLAPAQEIQSIADQRYG